MNTVKKATNALRSAIAHLERLEDENKSLKSDLNSVNERVVALIGVDMQKYEPPQHYQMYSHNEVSMIDALKLDLRECEAEEGR